jgi:uncharacterized protein
MMAAGCCRRHTTGKKRKTAMRIGVISDTHGFFDPQIQRLFEGVEHILHAGDIGFARIILELENIAPVTAVLGNTDGDLRFRETEALRLAGRKFLIHHIVNAHFPSETFKARLTRELPDVVVFGHTHKPLYETLGQTLFLNPGYAGKPRLGMPRSVATLDCDGGGISCQFHEL